jgi:hypothetical protein
VTVLLRALDPLMCLPAFGSNGYHHMCTCSRRAAPAQTHTRAMHAAAVQPANRQLVGYLAKQVYTISLAGVMHSRRSSARRVLVCCVHDRCIVQQIICESRISRDSRAARTARRLASAWPSLRCFTPRYDVYKCAVAASLADAEARASWRRFEEPSFHQRPKQATI